ncbi:hypothetical protein PQC07_gp205 [Aeromonas phage D3]|nr:hypothetical protein PQC07_gp205 [Aeromonas phage D3]YP_010668816.1 hypothetical protein PQC08_gp207 [Aeromonas phage D6]QLM02898.1 hypothetical protein D3_0070 [Aeromonas phage D3]QNH80841.1 hypothetical protein D6_0068 [Aeromonas phage D6]
MNKFEFLVEAFNARAYTRKTFLLSIFSLVKSTPNNVAKLKTAPYSVYRDEEEKKIYFFRPDGEKVFIEHTPFEAPLFHKNEKFTVDQTTNGWLNQKYETTVGIFLVNMVVIKEAVGDAGSYINGKIGGGTIKGLIDSIMVDNPGPEGTVPAGKASVNQCLDITKNLDFLEGMNDVFVKASSIDVLTVHPDVIAHRDKLLAELEKEGKLGDPVAVAKMIDEVVAMDAKIQYSGPSKDFFINGKFIDNARKKMFLIFDMVPDFNTGKYTLLRKSLNEGWDHDHFPKYINTAISASFDRGNATGEGGAEVKVAILLTNRISVGSVDCGTTRTEDVVISKDTFKGWVGGYHMVDGKPVLIESGDKALIGKPIKMRVPQFCVQPDDNLCRTCCGEKLGSIETRVSAEVVYIFTQFMLTRMKGMHVSTLKTITLDLDTISL